MQQYPLITIVGGSGFVGRHTVKLLATQGYRLRVLVRDTVAAEFLKTAATVGSIAIEHADITRPETLRGKFVGSSAVINLVSVGYESGRQTFDAVNAKGAAAVAAETARAGVPVLVQISSIGASAGDASQCSASKLRGEQAVRDAFPRAIIFRPALIVGPEDHFFQRFTRLSLLAPFLPLVGGGTTKFQPVLVTDVAKAILAAITHPHAAGNTYELTGPAVYSLREMFQMIGRITRRRLRFISVSPAIMRLKLAIAGTIWKVVTLNRKLFSARITPILTRDQLKRLARDNVATPGAKGFADLMLTPANIESALPAYLSRFVKD